MFGSINLLQAGISHKELLDPVAGDDCGLIGLCCSPFQRLHLGLKQGFPRESRIVAGTDDFVGSYVKEFYQQGSINDLPGGSGGGVFCEGA
ncbi:MAG: hypothetical protein JRF62_09885 [Deltaproteobacteria bacterium]|nr:hypothetical protein [Deltaproteobacteria bacterium]